LDFRDCFFYGLIDAPFKGHWICAGGDGLDTFTKDRLREHGSRRGAIAGNVRSLRGDFTHHLGTHIFQGVLQFNFLGYRNTVFGDRGRAKFLVDHDISAFRTERDFYRVSELIDPAQNC